jgi:hypothetical protein
MMKTWSFESTATPATAPRSQRFGSGFGHIGSTSNEGALAFGSVADPAPAGSVMRPPMTATERIPAALMGPLYPKAAV